MIEVIGFQAKKDEPDNPQNKIAFTLNGQLCFVIDPRAAHEIIKSAVADASMRINRKHRSLMWEDFDQYGKFYLVGRQLAARKDFTAIAKRA